MGNKINIFYVMLYIYAFNTTSYTCISWKYIYITLHLFHVFFSLNYTSIYYKHFSTNAFLMNFCCYFIYIVSQLMTCLSKYFILYVIVHFYFNHNFYLSRQRNAFLNWKKLLTQHSFSVMFSIIKYNASCCTLS